MIQKLTKELLDWMYQENSIYQAMNCGNCDYSKFAFVTDQVFNLCPYDDEVEEIWGHTICDVLFAICCKKNFEYFHTDKTHYHAYLIVCQLLDQYKWIEWGTSIRSCWIYEHEKSRKLIKCMEYVDMSDPRYDDEGIAAGIKRSQF